MGGSPVGAEEKLELARVVMATEKLLRRLSMQRCIDSSPDECMPALTPHQVQMIMAVHEGGSMTILQLTEVLHVKAPAASAMVDRLVELGLLTRDENPKDRREVMVRIAPAHVSRIQELEQRHLQAMMDLFERIGMDYARMWGSVCTRIRACVDAQTRA